MSDESQMQSSQIGAQTSVLFVSMFQVSGSLTSSVACGWNCPTISFHKKNHRDDHITLIITHHTACFFLKDLETQRLRDSDRDTVTETETETDYFWGVLWLVWRSVRVSICFCFKTRLLHLIEKDKPTTRLDRQWDTCHVSHVMWYLKKNEYDKIRTRTRIEIDGKGDRWGDKIDEDNGIRARKR